MPFSSFYIIITKIISSFQNLLSSNRFLPQRLKTPPQETIIDDVVQCEVARLQWLCSTQATLWLCHCRKYSINYCKAYKSITVVCPCSCCSYRMFASLPKPFAIFLSSERVTADGTIKPWQLQTRKRWQTIDKKSNHKVNLHEKQEDNNPQLEGKLPEIGTVFDLYSLYVEAEDTCTPFKRWVMCKQRFYNAMPDKHFHSRGSSELGCQLRA